MAQSLRQSVGVKVMDPTSHLAEELLKVCQKMNSERDLGTLLDLIAKEATKLMEADRASLFLLDRERGELWSKVALGSKEIRFDGLEEGRSVGELEKQWLAGGRVTETHAIEEQMLAAQHKVFLALEALLKKGIETTVDVYTGSLRRVVKSYTRKGNVALIIKRASAPVMKQFLRTMFPNFAFRRQLALRPIDLLRVNRALS